MAHAPVSGLHAPEAEISLVVPVIIACANAGRANAKPNNNLRIIPSSGPAQRCKAGPRRGWQPGTRDAKARRLGPSGTAGQGQRPPPAASPPALRSQFIVYPMRRLSTGSPLAVSPWLGDRARSPSAWRRHTRPQRTPEKGRAPREIAAPVPRGVSASLIWVSTWLFDAPATEVLPLGPRVVRQASEGPRIAGRTLPAWRNS
jgi:hypothetical protein